MRKSMRKIVVFRIFLKNFVNFFGNDVSQSYALGLFASIKKYRTRLWHVEPELWSFCHKKCHVPCKFPQKCQKCPEIVVFPLSMKSVVTFVVTDLQQSYALCFCASIEKCRKILWHFDPKNEKKVVANLLPKIVQSAKKNGQFHQLLTIFWDEFST